MSWTLHSKPVGIPSAIPTRNRRKGLQKTESRESWSQLCRGETLSRKKTSAGWIFFDVSSLFFWGGFKQRPLSVWELGAGHSIFLGWRFFLLPKSSQLHFLGGWTHFLCGNTDLFCWSNFKKKLHKNTFLEGWSKGHSQKTHQKIRHPNCPKNAKKTIQGLVDPWDSSCRSLKFFGSQFFQVKPEKAEPKTEAKAKKVKSGSQAGQRHIGCFGRK